MHSKTSQRTPPNWREASRAQHPGAALSLWCSRVQEKRGQGASVASHASQRRYRAKLCLTNIVSHEILEGLLSAYSPLMTPAAFSILAAQCLRGPRAGSVCWREDPCGYLRGAQAHLWSAVGGGNQTYNA